MSRNVIPTFSFNVAYDYKTQCLLELGLQWYPTAIWKVFPSAQENNLPNSKYTKNLPYMNLCIWGTWILDWFDGFKENSFGKTEKK